MAVSLYDISVPMFVNSLTDMRGWLDKAAAHKPEAELIAARLAPDMRALAAQYQMASDSAKNGIARLAGLAAPAMPDDETSFAQLRDRCDRTIAYVQSVDRTLIDDGTARTVDMKFPGGIGFRFEGLAYLTGFALPNFFFHVTTAYAILRAEGVEIGKPDYLAHIGPPNLVEPV